MLVLAAAAAGCTPAKPPAPPPAAAVLPPPAPPPPPVRRVLHAAWSFHSDAQTCTAEAKAGRTSLLIDVRPEGPIRITLSLPALPPVHPSARFVGPAGRWLMQGSRQPHDQAVFLLGRTDTALSQVLLLLSGGTLAVEAADTNLPILSLPQSGNDGQQWFPCARHSVTGT